MNQTLDLLKSRRSAKAPMLSEPGPDADALEAMLAVAARVPDHGKLAPWRFLLFGGAARDRAGAVIADVFAAAHPDADDKRLAIERQRFCAPVIVGVISRAMPHKKIPEWEQLMSVGAVCMNFIVAANAMGFATCWLTEWYAYDREVLRRFGLLPDEKIGGFIHVGTAPGPREERDRPILADLVTHFAS